MPCYDGRSDAERNREIQENNLKGIVSDSSKLTTFINECHFENVNVNHFTQKIDDLLVITYLLINRKDMLARLLCFVMNGLNVQAQEFLCEKNPELKKWWIEHQQFDKERTRCKQ